MRATAGTSRVVVHINLKRTPSRIRRIQDANEGHVGGRATALERRRGLTHVEGLHTCTSAEPTKLSGGASEDQIETTMSDRRLMW
jgi:hypothetical protein